MHACGSAAAGAADTAVRLDHSPKASSQRNEPPPTIATTMRGDPSSFVLGGAASARNVGGVENVTRERKAWSRPQPPQQQPLRLEQDIGNSGMVSLLGVPSAELEHQGPALQRRILDETSEDTAPTLPSSAVLEGEAVAQGGGATPGFAVSLPDTCDILEAEPTPPHSPIAPMAKMTILTPPTFDVGRAQTAAAVECAVDPASFAKRGLNAGSAEASPVDRFRQDCGEGGERVKGDAGDLDAASVTDVGGQGSGQQLSPQSRAREPSSKSRAMPTPTGKDQDVIAPAAEGENVPTVGRVGVDEKRLGGERQGRETESNVAKGSLRDGDMDSRSESESDDVLSDAESVPLLAVDGRQHGANMQLQQHQHDPGRTVTSPARPRSKCSVGGDVGCSDRPDETAQPLAGDSSSAERAEEDEETCDEAGSFRDQTGVALDSLAGGERSTAGPCTPVQREDQATDGEMAGPSKGDGLAQLVGPSVDLQGVKLRVAETAPQTSGLGVGVREKDDVVASLGADGDMAVPETWTQSIPKAEVRKPGVGESVAVSVGTDGSPSVPKMLAQSSPVAKVPERHNSSAEGMEGVNSTRLGVKESCLAHADKQKERRECGGGAAPGQQNGEKPRRLELGGKKTPGASSGAAQEAKCAERAASSQAAPLQQGLDEGVSTPVQPETYGRSGSQRQQQEDGGKESSELRVGGRQEDNQDEVPETLPPSQGADGDVGVGMGGSKSAITVCLATQALPEQDESVRPVNGGKGTHENDHDRRVVQQVPETPAQNITTQDIQSLATTQEVPETANAWGSNGASESTSAPLEGAAPAALMGNNNNSSSSPQSKVPKRKQTGPTCIERPGGALVSPGSRRAGAAGLLGAVDIAGGLEGSESPGSGRPKKRSAESATLSPSRSLSGPGSGRKRVRLTPTSDAGKTRPVGPKGASGDVQDSSNGISGGRSRSSMCQGTGGGEQGTPIALRGGSGSGESDEEGEPPEIDHDFAAVHDAWHAEGGYEFGEDSGRADRIDETDESRPPLPSPPPEPVEKKKSTTVVNPYAPQAHLDLYAGGGDSLLPAGAAAGSNLPLGMEASEGRTRPGSAAGTTAQASSRRKNLRRPLKGMMSFVSTSGATRTSSGLTDPIVTARLHEQRHHQSSNSILGAGRGHGPGETAYANASLEKTGSWSAYSLGPDTEVCLLL